MSFFKKQAFKIKDLLKEKNIKLSLVSTQEILAKSYGFNNRHVLLNQEESFNKIMSQIHNETSASNENSIKETNELDLIIKMFKLSNYKVEIIDSKKSLCTSYIFTYKNERIAVCIKKELLRLGQKHINQLKKDMETFDCNKGKLFFLNNNSITHSVYSFAKNKSIELIDKEDFMHMTRLLDKVSVTSLNNLPKVITKDNIKDLNFWWGYGDMPSHHPDSSPGSPFDEDYGFEDKDTFTIYDHKDKVYYNDTLVKNKSLVKDLCRWLGEEQIKQNNFEINFSSEDFIHDINIPNDQKEKIYNHILELQKMISNYSQTYTTKKKVLAPTKIVYQYNKKNNVFIKLQK